MIYFHFESLLELMGALFASGLINLRHKNETEKKKNKKKVNTWYKIINEIIASAKDNGSRVNETIAALRKVK
jgi:hypothetical protein